MSDVTDYLITKLEQRRQHGMAKYGGTLQPFDGRITELDIEEELLDALVYVTKMRMEREALADLLERGAIFIEDTWVAEGFQLASEMVAMVERLRADMPRIGGAA